MKGDVYMLKGKEIIVLNVIDKEYYCLSQVVYYYKMLVLYMKYKIFYKISKMLYWYIEKVEQDFDMGFDVFVFLKGVKIKDGKWVKFDNFENVVIVFVGIDIGKDLINDGVKVDGGNIVFGNDLKKEVYYIVKKGVKDIFKIFGKYNGIFI